MSEVITIGLDIAKHVFHVHGADERGRAVFSKKISRAKLLDFFAAQPSCKVALEACGGAHHWASIGVYQPQFSGSWRRPAGAENLQG